MVSHRQMPRPVNPHGEEVEDWSFEFSKCRTASPVAEDVDTCWLTARPLEDSDEHRIATQATLPSVFFSILSTTFRQFWCYQDTYLVDEEEDLSDVEIVVRPECEPSMV